MKTKRRVVVVDHAGFIVAPFDFSFATFVTSKLIKVLYGLAMLVAGLVTLLLVIGGFSRSTGSGLFMLLIGGPVIFITAVTYARIMLEFIIVVFRMSEHTAELSAQGRRGAGAQLR